MSNAFAFSGVSKTQVLGWGYRYTFQGQEADDEIKGEGNSMNYKYRMHDTRIGRFFAVDPLTWKYPYFSGYSFSGNRVIDASELEGLEYEIRVITPPKEKPFIEVTRKEDIPNGYYYLVYERVGATAVGEYEAGGSDVKKNLHKFNTDEVSYYIVSVIYSRITIKSTQTFASSDELSTHVFNLIEQEGERQKSVNETVTVAGKSKKTQTFGQGTVTNPQTFEITTTGTGTALVSNLEVSEANSTITILAQDTNSDYVMGLLNSFESKGYNVNLVQSDEPGMINVNDPKNPQGITVRVELGYDFDTEIIEKTENVNVEHGSTSNN